MIEKRETAGLMEYTDKIKKIQVQAREEQVRTIIDNIMRTLNILKTSISLTFNQSEPLKQEIKKEIEDEDFKDKVDAIFHGVSIKINNYFEQMFNLLTFREEEASLLADGLIQMVKITNELYSEKEAWLLKENRLMEPQEKKEIVATKEEDLFSEELETSPLPNELSDEILEEDEEEAVSIHNFIYECAHCKNLFSKVHYTGCRKCGSNTFRIGYITK